VKRVALMTNGFHDGLRRSPSDCVECEYNVANPSMKASDGQPTPETPEQPPDSNDSDARISNL